MADDVSALEAARLARGLSRERLAAHAGLSARTIYAIERGGVCPHRATVRMLTEVLGRPASELFPGMPELR